MKICPTCHKRYDDGAMVFCPADGRLLADEKQDDLPAVSTVDPDTEEAESQAPRIAGAVDVAGDPLAEDFDGPTRVSDEQGTPVVEFEVLLRDNPDLLKEGVKLVIPLWDSTSGDEKIKAKGANPLSWTGGLRYRYPWVPMSVTLKKNETDLYTEKNSSGEQSSTYDKEKKYEIRDGIGGKVIAEGTIKNVRLIFADAFDRSIVLRMHAFRQGVRESEGSEGKARLYPEALTLFNTFLKAFRFQGEPDCPEGPGI